MRSRIALAVLLASIPAAPHPASAQPPVPDAPADDGLADLGGARLYLEREVRPLDPERYVTLDPELSRLEAMHELAEGVTWTSMTTGAGTLAIAIGLAVDQREEAAAVLFGVSGGVLLVGLLVQALVRPSRDAVLDLFRGRG